MTTLPENAITGHAGPATDPTQHAPSLRARLVEMLLRMQVKRPLPPDTDLRALGRYYEALDQRKFVLPPDVRRTPVSAGSVRCEWVDVPASRPERVLLYLHGGGYVVRFPNLHARFAARVVRQLGCRALMVDYRLAPEHPYPAAVDDCLEAYRWLLAQGVAARDVVIAGDSAGGNATLVTLLRAKAAADPMPGCAVALSPVVDCTLSSPSLVENERSDALFRLATLILLRAQYCAPERTLDPFVSPLFGDLAGLPPLLLQAGSSEMLRDESTRFAQRARDAGVDVELEIWNGMQHCFQLLQFLPESTRAIDAFTRFVRRRTGWPELHSSAAAAPAVATTSESR